MTKWRETSTVYVGDAFGDPVQIEVGVVTIGKRTTVGCRRANAASDRPDYTLDVEGIGDLIKALTAQRSALIEATGGW